VPYRSSWLNKPRDKCDSFQSVRNLKEGGGRKGGRRGIFIGAGRNFSGGLRGRNRMYFDRDVFITEKRSQFSTGDVSLRLHWLQKNLKDVNWRLVIFADERYSVDERWTTGYRDRLTCFYLFRFRNLSTQSKASRTKQSLIGSSRLSRFPGNTGIVSGFVRARKGALDSRSPPDFPADRKGCKCDPPHPSRCAYDSSDTRMNDWIATMNIIRRVTVKCRSGPDQARLRGGRGGVGRKPPVKSEREPRRRGEAQGRGEGPPGWLCDVIMLTKLFHCSAVYSDARIKAAEQWGGRDGESSEIGTRRRREREREREGERERGELSR